MKALRVASRPHVGEGLLAPSEIGDRSGLARGRAEQRGIGGVDRFARGSVGLAANPFLAGRKFDVIDWEVERAERVHRRRHRFRGRIVTRQHYYFFVAHVLTASLKAIKHTPVANDAVPVAIEL